ncbi:hypothetical protein IEO21_08071 [Rhodonia placenta]|uniref:N-acetyltransferase domain-containing protein n=1 Tax=Rhodonia placenta TaxID=104341 RepID=A0A8H7NX98_9APHY|nr:hypothetical protein IEO21_08071 [Postia placenta]
MAPSNLTISHVEKPDEKLVEEAVQLVVKLMRNGGNLDLFPDWARSIVAASAFISGEMYAAIDESNTLVGFAMWMPPGRVPLTTEEERQLGWNQFWKKLSPEGRDYTENVLGKDFPKFLEKSFGFPDVQESTYWCSFAMIREDYQNKGVATAIFDLVYAKAKETGAIMALGTSLEMTYAFSDKDGCLNLVRAIRTFCIHSKSLRRHNSSKDTFRTGHEITMKEYLCTELDPGTTVSARHSRTTRTSACDALLRDVMFSYNTRIPFALNYCTGRDRSVDMGSSYIGQRMSQRIPVRKLFIPSRTCALTPTSVPFLARLLHA